MSDPKPPRIVLPSSQDIDLLIDALARASAANRGLMGEQAIAHVEELKARVVAVEDLARSRVDDAEARRRAAEEIDKLIDTLGRVQNTSGRALQHANPQIKAAFRGVDLGRMAAGLRYIADWLREPTPEAEAEIMHTVEQLRAITGAVDPMMDPWADDKTAKQLRDDIDADVKKSLDDIFGDLNKKIM